jgi:RNA polymerase sigma factor (sigma-70 family)
VFLVEDDRDVADYLEVLLAASGYDTQVFATGGEFLQRYAPRPPACALIDLRLPGINGIELLRRLRLRNDHLPVVMMTGYPSASTAVEAMKLGALDYVEKPIDPVALLKAVDGALEVARKQHERRVERETVAGMMARLTPREREVLELVVAGHPSKDIAEQLGLSKKTVDLHRSHIMSKLQAQSVVDVVTMALTGRRTRRTESV